jgi:DNA-binding NtrC family response regulator
VVALDLIRRIERHGLGFGQAAQGELLESCRRLLEARWLAVLSPRAATADENEPVSFLAHAGPLPDGAEVDQLRVALAGASPSGPAAGDLLCRASAEGGAALALRRQAAGPIRPWQLDFFDFLASKSGSAATGYGGPQRREARSGGDLVLPPGFVPGPSPAMTQLLTSIRATVHSGLDVLLIGETGTGKELVARLVHDSGPTARGPFIAINCAAIPADLLEAELFGVEARVATGVDPRPGLFVRAEGGTLFLDEIGDMSEPMQAKLLRALQEREVLPIGAHRPKRIHVRVVSASNKPLAELVRAGRFRADLFYRLRGLQFHLPPLRERKEDIPALTAYFATSASDRYGKPVRGVSRRVLELLSHHDWPGNVRELRNEVERAVLLAEEFACLEERHFGSIRWQVEHGPAEAEAAPPSIATAAPPSAPPGVPRSLAERVDELERRAIREALAASRQNKSRAARLLGITRNGLALKLKRLGIEEPE